MAAQPSTADSAASPTASPTASSSLINPAPLSIPAFLVNPKSRSPSAPRPSSSTPRRHQQQPGLNAKVDRTGRRKILRRENSRLSGNPHVVRPRATDYAPAHAGSESYKATFPTPVPPYLASLNVDDAPRDERVARDWRREWEDQMQDQRRGPDVARPQIGHRVLEGSNSTPNVAPPQSGLFTMSLSEARFFLKRRAGVTCRAGGIEGADDPAPMTAITPMQDLVNRVEGELAAWIDQVVYLPSESPGHGGIDTTRLNAQPKVIVPDLSLTAASSSSAAPSARVEEHHHLPHSLSYLIRDPFDRLTVHCLARVWGLRSLSKPIGGSSGSSDRKLTWIFKPASKGRGGVAQRSQRATGPEIDVTHGRQADRAPNNGGGYINPLIRHLANVGISGSSTSNPTRATSFVPPRNVRIHVPETPPTTDIGSELDSGSEVGFGLESSSEVDGEGDSASVAGRPGQRGGPDVLSDVAESDSESESGAVAAAGSGQRDVRRFAEEEADETLRPDHCNGTSTGVSSTGVNGRGLGAIGSRDGDSEGYSDYEGEYEYDEDDVDVVGDSGDEEASRGVV